MVAASSSRGGDADRRGDDRHAEAFVAADEVRSGGVDTGFGVAGNGGVAINDDVVMRDDVLLSNCATKGGCGQKQERVKYKILRTR